MSPTETPALALLRDPARAPTFGADDWNRALPALRRHGLTARVARDARLAGVLDDVAPAARRHLSAAEALADHRRAAALAEITRVQEALAVERVPFVLLKGAAYVAAEAEAGRGRLFEDVDVLVAEADLLAAERGLMRAGWAPERLNAYDTRYYRRWMHQVPPLIHIERGSVVDLHHGLLPRTSRLEVDAASVRRDARPLARWPGASLPRPADLLLHSALHALMQEDVASALRDLVDMDRLVRAHQDDTAFVERLQHHAGWPDAAATLALAFDLMAAFLATPVCQPVARAVSAGRRSYLAAQLFRTALSTQPEPPVRSALAASALFVRGHHLKMPLPLLIRHIAHKALRSTAGSREPAGER